MIIKDNKLIQIDSDDFKYVDYPGLKHDEKDVPFPSAFPFLINENKNKIVLLEIPSEVSNIDCQLPFSTRYGCITSIECFENLNALNDSIKNENQCVQYIFLNIDKNKIIITINIKYHRKLDVYSKKLDEDGYMILIITIFSEELMKSYEDKKEEYILEYSDTRDIKNITLMLNDKSIKILKSNQVLQKKFQNRKEFLKKFVKWIYNTNESIEIKYAFPNVSTDYLNINKSNLGVEKNLPNEILNSIRNFLDGKSKKRIKKSKSKKRIKKSKKIDFKK